MWLEVILGLRINLEKSELILMKKVENLDDLIVGLGCKVGSLPSSYLGLLWVLCLSLLYLEME